ncbi:MAG: hypothetical protein WC428_02280 [Candidatus Paceibacterota bacterium]
MSLQATPEAKEPKVFEEILLSLKNEVVNARGNSDDLKNMVSKLSQFNPNCDMEKGTDALPAPEGVITSIKNMLEELKFINRRNSEILMYFNGLV